MDKTINRKMLRNAPLLPFCGNAHTTRHEYGPDDNRVYCYGVIDMATDEYLVACKKMPGFCRQLYTAERGITWENGLVSMIDFP